MSTAAERSGRPARPEDAVIPGLEVSLWEQMLSAENLGRAPWRVRANGGAPGVDGMTTEELVPWLREHWAPVRQALDAGTYRPSPVRRVVIDLPRAFRTADLRLIHAAGCCSRYSSCTCCGVRY